MFTSGPRAAPFHDHVLHAFRAAMPQAAGVILSTHEGRVLAHEDLSEDPRALAAQAVHQHAQTTWHGAPGASAMVEGNAGFYLVVFVPPE